MSGVMLKVALYGLIRFTFELLGDVQSEWGGTLLIFSKAKINATLAQPSDKSAARRASKVKL
jgi:NADH:ubiquinone oxidoreductase subunit 4 (subunit M)